MRRSILFEGVTVTLLLLLIFLLIAMIMGESGPSEKSIPGSDQVQYIYTGSDNTLYMFFDDHIRAVDATGNEMWDFTLPPQLKIAPGWRFTHYPGMIYVSVDMNAGPIACTDNGTMYVYVVHNESYTGSVDAKEQMSEGLVAISGKGKELWSIPLQSLLINTTQYQPDSAPDYNVSFSDAYIQAQGGRIYVFHGYNETVMDGNGSVLWSADGVAAPASVDEYGFVYCVPTMEPPREYSRPLLLNVQYYSDDLTSQVNYLVPSAMVDAYYPNGTHYWRKYPGEPLYRQYMSDPCLPLYNNGTIYAPLENGIAAFDRQGNEKWMKKYNPDDFYLEYTVTNSTGFKSSSFTESYFSLYGAMPFDSKGNLYAQYLSGWVTLWDDPEAPLLQELNLIAIGPDGTEIARNVISPDKYRAVNNGIGYNTSMSDAYPMTVENLTDMGTKNLTAYNVNSGTKLWDFTFPVENPTIVTVDASNAGEISRYLTLTYPYPVNDGNTAVDSLGNANVSMTEIRTVMAGDGRVYAQFSSVIYEVPVVYGKSKAAYASGVYALDENGSLMWSKAISSNAYDMKVVNNSTIIYRNGDGKLVMTNTGAAVGFALTTFLYIFIRFFCVGAIARAHSRINQNANRNAVYDFVAKNPGMTMYEVSRGLKMNLGTVRYHAFILGMNHRIVPYKDDGKYIRYFTNSNSFSAEDQLIVSLMRRDAVGKVLMYMMTKPTAPNADMARDLGLQESIVSRCVKELAEKGVIAKETYGTRSAYAIVDSRRDRVASAMRRIYDDIS